MLLWDGVLFLKQTQFFWRLVKELAKLLEIKSAGNGLPPFPARNIER